MMEKVSDRERLSWEIEALNDDQVREVLEYISIMRSMQGQEGFASRIKHDGSRSFIGRVQAPSSEMAGGPLGDVVEFPGSRRLASD
jgi:hypothetical protein